LVCGFITRSLLSPTRAINPVSIPETPVSTETDILGGRNAGAFGKMADGYADGGDVTLEYKTTLK